MVSSVLDRRDRINREVKDWRIDLERRVGARDRVKSQLDEERARLEHLREEAEVLDLTQKLALALEGAWRKTFESALEEVVSDGLTLVMGQGYFLHIKSRTVNDASAVTFTIETPHGETPLIGSRGGSIGQIVSFLLRLMVVIGHRPELRKVIFIDEPFTGVNPENIPHVANLLRKMVDETGIQLFLVTNLREFSEVADTVVDVRKGGRHAKVVVLQQGAA